MPPSSVPAPPRRLIVATANPGKLREFHSLLDGLPFELRSLADLNLPSPAETGASFLANATLKARHAANLSGCAAVADDSGLEVDALQGAPGIFSARYAGADATDDANNAKLVAEIKRISPGQRQARYRCALVYIDAPGDAVPLVAEAAWEGSILDTPRGVGGFGYDAYFWLPELEMTAAELKPEVKNSLSHRGRAMRALRDLLSTRAQSGARA
jgi:XTP/dITP diphosphohydrolase